VEKVAKKRGLDFVLYIGDDPSNEPVFTYLNELTKSPLVRQDAKIYTCTVGRKPTQAKYFLSDQGEVSSLLQTIQGLGKQPIAAPQPPKTFSSMVHLPVDEI